MQTQTIYILFYLLKSIVNGYHAHSLHFQFKSVFFVLLLFCNSVGLLSKKNKNKVSEANPHCQSVTFTTSGVTNSECLMPRVKDGDFERCK